MDCSYFADALATLDGSHLFAFLAQAVEAAPEADEGISAQQWLILLATLAVMVLPFVVGRYVARALRVPGDATRFGFVLLAVVAAVVVLSVSRPKLGVDLRGGTILVYEIDPEKRATSIADGGSAITSRSFVQPLTDRINPSGTQEIVIRPYGETQIEIIVPEVDQREVDRIKTLVEEAGILRFAILANQADHQGIIDQAIEQSRSNDPAVRRQQVVGSPEDLLYGRWVTVGRESQDVRGTMPLRVDVGNAVLRNADTGAFLQLPPELLGDDREWQIARWMDRQGISAIETLMVINPALDILGEDLSFAASTFDENGRPAVAFNLTDSGSPRFRALTTNNAPVGTRQRRLGIVLDDTLLSAPSILQPISKEGRITGNFTREEVRRLVDILEAGQLPAALTPQPIAENQVDATLGADTIRKGVWAIGTSLALVLIFILIYYRFAGIVACSALILNLAMILATMVLINQPLSLPGLAGLVLTVGMSVDANVLIFERIREELKKGAKPRMAIRNGFGRATTTIIDANLTTLITAIVLYAIGTDQIRGFAVTLILGILYSMFTAIYMSRTIFDLAERRGFLSLSMMDFVDSIRSALAGGGQFDFVSKGKFTLALSAVLLVIGVGGLYARGRGIFDIDFAGGSSVQFRLDEPTTTDNVRQIVGAALTAGDREGVQFTVNGVNMDRVPAGTVYKVDSSIDDVDLLKQIIQDAFAAEGTIGMVTYQVSVSREGDTAGNATTDPSRHLVSAAADNGVRLAAFQGDDAATPDEDASAGDTTDGDESAAAVDAMPRTSRTIELGFEGRIDPERDAQATMNAPTLIAAIVNAAQEAEIPLTDRGIRVEPLGEDTQDWNPGSSLPFNRWRVTLPLDETATDRIMDRFAAKVGSDAVWISSSSVGARVAGDMIGRALAALFASLLCIIGYIWFRFQRVIFGFAAVAALLHDVLITLGAIAVSYWLADYLGFLLIDPFKISLTVVAALLTIIGYSLNDTIVVFDRIRETKGKSPRLTGEMVNHSINLTLSRTLLTSLTTLIVVVLLYAFGGEGIHAFAFCLVIGVLVGTYSSVFVATPILMWLVGRSQKAVS